MHVSRTGIQIILSRQRKQIFGMHNAMGMIQVKTQAIHPSVAASIRPAIAPATVEVGRSRITHLVSGITF